jgi:hypothetical protein
VSRFAKYAGGDLPPLFKPEPGQSRTGKLKAVGEWVSKDGEEFPILTLVDEETGEEFAYRASPWRARECLAELDPPDGAVLEIRRGVDIGQSYDVQITFAGVDAAAPRY